MLARNHVLAANDTAVKTNHVPTNAMQIDVNSRGDDSSRAALSASIAGVRGGAARQCCASASQLDHWEERLR